MHEKAHADELDVLAGATGAGTHILRIKSFLM
jgi:hypothetical protein